MITSGRGIAWVGKINDNYFGNISASSYFSFSLPYFNVDTSAIFDSLTLVIKNYSDFYGDTTNYHKINVYELNNVVKLNYIGYLYNTSKIDTKLKLAELNFMPRPKHGKIFEVRLPDIIGDSLLRKFINKSTEVKSVTNFQNYFGGIALIPDNSENSLISCFVVKDSAISLHLHYHYNVLGKADNIIYVLADPSLQFNHIEPDKDNPIKKTLKLSSSYPDHRVNSILTGNNAFIQGLTGISTILEFPYLNDLQLLGKTVSISNAVLTIRPIPGSYNKTTPLPDSLSLSILDESNNLYSSYELGLITDYINYGLNTQYSTNITSLMKNQLGAFNRDKKIIKLGLPGSNKSFALKRLVFGNGQNLKNQAKMELKLMIYGTN